MIQEKNSFRECETRSDYDEDSAFRCDCSKHAVVVRGTTSDEQLWVGIQCKRCGKKARRAKRLYSAKEIDRMPPLDNDLHSVFMRRASAIAQTKLEAERRAHDEVWWRKYSLYLKTPEWKKRRAKVLQRANHWCEACLEARATEVHHTTYKHLGNEPLFELRAVCHECHDGITEMDRGQR